ncbi:hypothetical protein [Aureimonas glaciei]|nr:hypothetical protein [Aureimonas glaciei]
MAAAFDKIRGKGQRRRSSIDAASSPLRGEVAGRPMRGAEGGDGIGYL